MSEPVIDSYHFGEVIIDGKSYRKDVIIFPDRVRPDWWREKGHSLSIADLAEVLSEPPAVLVIGQGAYGRMVVPSETRHHLAAAGIRVVEQPTDQACQTYNRLRSTGNVVAALHLTC